MPSLDVDIEPIPTPPPYPRNPLKDAGHDLVRRWIPNEPSDHLTRRLLHRFGNCGGTRIERSAEDPGERQRVVDLVREVRKLGGDDRGILGCERPGGPPGRDWPRQDDA